MLKRILSTLAAAAAIAATAAISAASARGGHGHGGHHGHAHHAHAHAHGGHAHGHRWSRHGSFRHFSHFHHFRHFSHFHHFNHYRRFAHYHYGHYRWAGRVHWRGRGYWWWARYHRWYYPGVAGTDAPAAYDTRQEVVTSPDDAPGRPCAEIVAACRQAGFVQGGARAGNGLQLDCIVPIIQGTPQPRQASLPLPWIAPRLVAACVARNPNFGQLSEASPWAAAELETESGFRSGPRPR
jgi:Ni/Co efflux regulator RcnB